MNEPVLVTGATGFIGSYLVRLLVDNDRCVRVLVRSPEKLSQSVRDRVEIVTGDLTGGSAASVAHTATAGTRTILHLAAVARTWSRHPAEFESVNVGLVKHLTEAAADNGVERFVHVSTILTLPPFRPSPANGSSSRRSPYEATKTEGERLVEEYARAGHHAVIVHPTRVYGPGPLTQANAVTIVTDSYLRGHFRFRLADGDVMANYVHAADVANGIVAAAEKGTSGAHYILGGDNATFAEFLEMVGQIGRQHYHVFAVPPSLALVGARLAQWWGQMRGEVSVTPEWVRIFLEDRRVDITQTQRDLNYEPRSLSVGLAETIAWLSQRNDTRNAA